MSDKFGLTFVWTAILTFLAFPFVFFGSSGALGLSWVVGFWLVVSMVIPAALFSALAFWGLDKFISRLGSPRMSFVAACGLAFFVGVWGAFHTNIDFFPPKVSFFEWGPQHFFPILLASVASVSSMIVAALLGISGENV